LASRTTLERKRERGKSLLLLEWMGLKTVTRFGGTGLSYLER